MRYLFYCGLFFTLSFTQFDWPEDGAPIRQGLHIEWQRTGDSNADGTMIYAWSDCRDGVRDVIAQKVDTLGINLWGVNGKVVVKAEGRQEDPQLVTDGAGGAYIIWMDYRNETDSEGDIYAQHVFSDGTLEWEEDGRALVNQTGQQASPNICSDGQNGAYVIWKDITQSTYGDIYATHLSIDGIIAEGTGVPIITYSSYRSSPSLNTGGSRDAVLVWSDDRNTDADLYAQRISVDSDNNTIGVDWGDLGAGGKLVCDAFGDQTSPRVTQYMDDEIIITWEDQRNGYICGSGYCNDVYYQILNGNGDGQLIEDGVSVCSGAWEITKPRVKAKNSMAFIVWEDERNEDTSDIDIFVQKIDSGGLPVWEEDGLAVTTAEGKQTEPRLETDGSGGVYFVWEDARNEITGRDIYAQHKNSSGSNINDADEELNGVKICNANYSQFNPLVRNDGFGGAIIIWGDQRYEGSYSMNVQRLLSSGITLADDETESFFGIATDAASESYEHGIVYLNNNEALVYWQDDRFGKTKIYGTKINSAYDGTSDYFSNEYINGDSLTSLSFAQKNPKAILAGNNIFLSFKVEEYPNENLYFQLMDLNLNTIGNATALSDPNTTKHGFEMVKGNDGYIYYAYSEDTYIAIQKLSSDGDNIWTQQVVESAADDIIQAVYSHPESGCVIIYESKSWQTGSHLYALGVDGDGQIQDGWPVILSNLSGDQYYEHSVETADGIFISFKDNTAGNYDMYGQYLAFSGGLNFGDNGIAIENDGNSQEASSLAYNPGESKVLVCYETFDGSFNDINCKEINLAEQSISETIIISDNAYNQEAPNVYWSGDSYLIAWEDTRNSTSNSPEKDIYFQEYQNNNSTFTAGGEALCTYSQTQKKPLIAQYSLKSFVIIWEDLRSTGKALCANLYGQSFSTCSALGDLNDDGWWNVLDVVTLANCILAGICEDVEEVSEGCSGDINGDGWWNVLDIVQLANCVLSATCGGRIDDATQSRLIIRDNHMYIDADGGYIGGVQMTLQHGADFTIEMTERASAGTGYLTSNNETILLVIEPETEELFSFAGDFEIVEVIVANSYAEVPASLPMANSFSLGDAYPNPFNPTTVMELNMSVAGDIQVDVYNLLGQSVATITSGYKEIGKYNLTWDATDAASGVYFVKAQADGFTKIQKLMLVK